MNFRSFICLPFLSSLPCLLAAAQIGYGNPLFVCPTLCPLDYSRIYLVLVNRANKAALATAVPSRFLSYLSLNLVAKTCPLLNSHALERENDAL
jgi:hypothetical protein